MEALIREQRVTRADGVAGAAPGGALEQLQATSDPVTPLLHLKASFEEQVVRLEVIRAPTGPWLLVKHAERDSQTPCNVLCDVILDREHVIELPVVTIGPELEAISNVDQLRGDP